MNWYYAVGQETRGPFAESELLRLLHDGTISPQTYVWSPALSGWQALAESPLGPTARVAAEEFACIVTGRKLPASQLIKTEHGWVSAEGRDTYFRSIREDAPLVLADADSNVKADGRLILAPRYDAQFPLRCIKTNQRVDETQVRRKVLYPFPVAIFLTLIAGPLFFVIFYFCCRQKVEVYVPVSDRGRAAVRTHQLVGFGLLLASTALFVVGLVHDHHPLTVTGLAVLLCSLLYLRTKGRLIRVARYEADNLWLAGACPDYLRSLRPARRL